MYLIRFGLNLCYQSKNPAMTPFPHLGNSCSTPEGIATTERHHAFFKQVLQYCREREGRLSISNELDSRLGPLMKEMGELEEKDWEEFFALWKDFPMIKFPPVTKSFYFGSPTTDHSAVFSK